MKFLYRLNNIKFFVILFLFSLFLIKAPPFYYFPLDNKLFLSHTLVKLLLLGSFCFFISVNIRKTILIFKKKPLIFLFLLLFFLTQSLSIITSTDTYLFWKTYHNIIFSIIIFTFSYILIRIRKENLQMISDSVVIFGMVFILLELIFLIFGRNLISYLKILIQKEVLDAYQTNIARGRYTLELNLEIFLPFFILKFFSSTKKNFILLLGSIVIIYLSFISNFRTRVLIVLFAIFVSLFLVRDRLSSAQKTIVLFSTIVIIFISLKTSVALFRFNVIDRFFISENFIGVKNTSYRIDSINKSIELFLSSPIVGIGLGNYRIFNSRNGFDNYLSTSKPYEIAYADLVRYSPHNIFLQIISETGFLGLTAFIILIVYFLVRDFKVLIKKDLDSGLKYILSSWTLFIYALFNPASSIFIIGWFWFLRGVIEGYY